MHVHILEAAQILLRFSTIVIDYTERGFVQNPQTPLSTTLVTKIPDVGTTGNTL